LLEVVVENEENVFPMITTGASVSEIILDFVQEVLYTWEYEIVSYNT
jgi:hypothetical protein